MRVIIYARSNGIMSDKNRYRLVNELAKLDEIETYSNKVFITVNCKPFALSECV